MKKYLSIVVGLMLVLGAYPVFALNDLTLQTSVQLSAGTTFTVSGDYTVDSITVNADNFTVTLSPGGSLTVTAPGGTSIGATHSDGILTDKVCSSAESRMQLVARSTASAETVTISASGTCGGSTGGTLNPVALATVNLGSASNFVILSKSGISNTGTSAITGNIGVSPIAATAITGFGLVADSTNTFSKSSLVTGNVYASTYAVPTPATMTTAVSNMETAYTDAAGRTNPTSTELGAGNIGGMTLAPGLYKWSSNVTIPTDVILSGSASGVWIFQIGGNLNISSGKSVILSGGAQASNIFWQVSGQTTLGTTSVFNGTILDQAAIVMNTGATLNGRALAQTAVTLDSNIISSPVAVVTPTPVVEPLVVVTTPTSTGNGSSTGSGTSTTGTSGTTGTIGTSVTSGTTVTAGTTTTTGTTVTTTSAPTVSYTFSVPLKLGSKGTDVTELQKVLVAKGYLNMPAGVAYGTFGNLTQSAVKKYQAANGIDQLGNVGPATRASLNASVASTASTGSSQLSSAQIEVLKSQLQSLQAQLLILLSQQMQLLKAQQ